MSLSLQSLEFFLALKMMPVRNGARCAGPGFVITALTVIF